MAKILIIDDDAAIRRTLGRVLSKAGHVVMDAADGRQAMELFRADPAELVITDIVMPTQEGIETILEIRREAPGVGIIAISGGGLSSGMTYLDLAGKLGADAVLSKPFRAPALLNAVAKLLSFREDR